MKKLENTNVSIAIDERFPRILYYQSAAGVQVLGEAEAAMPRVYVWRRSDRATLTSDQPEVEVSYTCEVQAAQAVCAARSGATDRRRSSSTSN